MKRKRNAPAAPRRTLRNPFRTNSPEHELIAREAFAFGPPKPGLAPISLNDWICQQLFKPGWEKRLERLRALQRAAGIPDEEFLHRSEKLARGIKAKPGRRSWNHMVLASA